MLSCAHCGGNFEGGGSRGPKPKYCSGTCRNRAKWDRQKASNPCPGCGQPMARRSSSSSDEQKCRACRTTSEHGTYAMYKKHGCRCDPCREANRVEHARWRARRRQLNKPVKPSARRDCDQCGVAFLARTDTGQRYCSVACAKKAQGWDGTPRDRFRVAPEFRRAIYEEDGWTCQLCFSPVRPEVDPKHPRYPTLDHIKPRSRGGSDDRENLRTACMQCNAMRGANEDWSHPEAVAS